MWKVRSPPAIRDAPSAHPARPAYALRVTSVPASRAARLTPTVLLCLALVYVLWGSTYFGIKVAIESLPPMPGVMPTQMPIRTPTTISPMRWGDESSAKSEPKIVSIIEVDRKRPPERKPAGRKSRPLAAGPCAGRRG